MASKKVLTGRVDVTQPSHNLMTNECEWKTPGDKKTVRMVRVTVYYKDSQGTTDMVSMQCCCEHQYRATDHLIAKYGLTH
jgi:hypothetical protein